MPVATAVPLPQRAFDELMAFALPVFATSISAFIDTCEYSCYHARPPTSGRPLFVLNCAYLI
jgi:hypothetical protein